MILPTQQTKRMYFPLFAASEGLLRFSKPAFFTISAGHRLHDSSLRTSGRPLSDMQENNYSYRHDSRPIP